MARGIEVHNGKVSLKDIVELGLTVDLGKNKTITEHIYPFKVAVDKTSNWYPVDEASTIDGDMFVGWLVAQVGEKPTGSSTILRLENNTKGITIDSVFDTLASGVPQGNFSYWFTANPATGVDAWDTSGDYTTGGVAGMLKCRIGGVVRHIQLYYPPT